MKRKTISIALQYAAFGCGLLSGLFGLFAGFLQFETGTHYFLRGSVLPMLAVVFAILGALVALVPAFLEPVCPSLEPRRISHLPPAAGFFVSAFLIFLLPASPAKVALRLAVAATILLLLSAAYCLLSFFLKDPKYRGLLALLGFSPILALATFAFFYYFDKSVEMNSPLKVTLQTALLFGMFLFLCEVRRLLEKPLPRLLAGFRLAFFPISALAVGMILSAFFTGAFLRLDYLFGAFLLLTLQFSLAFNLFLPNRNDR